MELCFIVSLLYLITMITDVKTPLVILVVGGDKFTLQKVRDATSKQIPVVIVNGSGAIANMLAYIYQTLEHSQPR